MATRSWSCGSSEVQSADDWIAQHARDHSPYWLVTSDREPCETAPARTAERMIGGGSFLGELDAA